MAGAGLQITVELRWPSKALILDSRSYDVAREDAGWRTRYVMPLHYRHDGSRLSLRFEACPPSAAERVDDAALLARLRPDLEGIAVALGAAVDCFDFVTPMQRGDPVRNGLVRVSVNVEA